MLLPINLLIIIYYCICLNAKRTVLVVSIIEVISIIVIIVNDILLYMTYWLQKWCPMTIMCPGLKSLTKNLGMILQAPAHRQRLLLLLHMTLLHLLLELKDSAQRKGHFAQYNCLVLGHTKYMCVCLLLYLGWLGSIGS
jgi:hypothetical protein